MKIRSALRALVALAILGALVVPSPAQAATCTPIPGSTTGVTIEAAGQEVRVPSLSGLTLCYEGAGLIGLPRVDGGYGCEVACLVLGSGSGTDGYVRLYYSVDGSASSIGAPIPGGGGGSESCLLGIGLPARSDCLIKVSPDEIPDPPPIPPIPPVPPIPPIPDQVCVSSLRECIPLTVDGLRYFVNEFCNNNSNEILACEI